ncbi:hypothetical protein Chor_000729 [Crotalus horridus]
MVIVKRYIRKGIPNEHRAEIWMVVSGAQSHMDHNPGYYQKLLEGDHNSKLVETIMTDINRTFPDNIKFRKTAVPCLQKTLYNVLVAYGHHNPSVGYCQLKTCNLVVFHLNLFGIALETGIEHLLSSIGSGFKKKYCASTTVTGDRKQGMNFIAGYLILITRNEEESFWLLDALIGRILPGMFESHLTIHFLCSEIPEV